MRHVIRNILIAFSFTACSAAYAATSVPFTFVAGHGARASEVNANFEALAAAIDAQVAINEAQAAAIDAQVAVNTAQAAKIAALTSRVTLLDTPSAVTAADLVGTYSFHEYETTLSGGALRDGVVRVDLFKGTIQLFADGTATISGGSSGISQLNIRQTPTSLTSLSSSVEAGVSGSFPWALVNGQVVLFGELFLTIVSGGRLLVNTNYDHGIVVELRNAIMVLVRTN